MRSKHMGLQVRILCFFVAENGCSGSGFELLQLFCCDRLCRSHPP